MSTDTPPTDDAEEPTDKQLDALADRVIDRMEQRGDIDADGLVARSSRRGILKALGAGALGAGVVGGASSDVAADLSTDGDAMAVGGTLDVDESYRISGRWYMGPKSARPSSPSTNEQAIWEITDVGDAGTTKPTRYTGSQWVPMGKDLDSLATERLNTRVYTVGPDKGNKYQSLAAAMDDITDASRTKHYTLWLTGDLTGTNKDDSHIEVKSHVNVIGNGNRVEVDDPDFAVQLRGDTDLRWENLTIDHAPSTSTSFTAAVQFEKATDSDVVFKNVRAIGQSQGSGGSGFTVIDNAAPRLVDCEGVAGDGGDGSSGLTFNHGCTPIVEGGTFYGGNGGTNCHGVAMGNGSPAPTLRGVTAIGGQKNADNYGIAVKEGAAPELVDCEGRYKIYPQFFTGTGSGSDIVDSGNPLDKYNAPENTTGWPSVLLGVEIRILTAASGATLDIGTTSGGAEIAANIDASTTHRVAPNYTRQRFVSGDEIYVTPSDASVEYNLRYILGVDQNSAGLLLDTYGEAVVSGGTYASGTRSAAAEIGQKSTDSKKYSIGGATFRPVDDSSQVGISGTSDSGATDPIRNCAIFGGVTNLTPAQN